MATKHEEATAAFVAAGFHFEDFLGVFMYSFDDDNTMTCAWDWEGSGAWSAQYNDKAEDFQTAAEVIAWRDSFKLGGR